MTTHTGHDHDNTKAGRAACRRAALNGTSPKTAEEGAKDRHPAGKSKGKPRKAKANTDGPDSDICEHPADLIYRGICVDCERVVGMVEHDVPESTIARYDELIERKAARGRARTAQLRDPGLPHEFDNDLAKPGRCYVCKKIERSPIHPG